MSKFWNWFYEKPKTGTLPDEAPEVLKVTPLSLEHPGANRRIERLEDTLEDTMEGVLEILQRIIHGEDNLRDGFDLLDNRIAHLERMQGVPEGGA